MQVEILPGGGLDFLDPWGNRVQVVEYRDIQFTKAPEVLDGMGLSKIEKSAEALRALADKGMARGERRGGTLGCSGTFPGTGQPEGWKPWPRRTDRNTRTTRPKR